MPGHPSPRRVFRRPLALALLALCALPALAELADLYLRNGLRLRGDVTQSGDEVILRNALGEVRYPRSEVARIVPVPTTTAPAPTAPDDAAPTTAPTTEPAEEEGDDAEEDDGATGEQTAVPPAPTVSKADISRLRLFEMREEGGGLESVRLQFTKKGRQRELATEVLDDLKRQGPVSPEIEETLTRGQPLERLAVILDQTGEKHIDRIEIQSDPLTFVTFRRQVLPTITANCARSGCHGGTGARVFRFPIGSRTGDAYVYSSFAMLDAMETPSGRLIDREAPEKSLLLSYLLPESENARPHPKVTRPPLFRPAARGTADPVYLQTFTWISELSKPRPTYGLSVEFPYANIGDGASQATPTDSQPSVEEP